MMFVFGFWLCEYCDQTVRGEPTKHQCEEKQLAAMRETLDSDDLMSQFYVKVETYLAEGGDE